MNIQAEKIALIKMLLDTDNPSILASIKNIFAGSIEVDFWDELSNAQKAEVEKGIKELEQGKGVSFEEFLSEYK